ncbi:MAG: ABC transporter ATP-binding protein [Candidatus Gracilibacteria bacterium]|nr:ABC transporter ATP-binding protein [Candidatus Gracilibacteria bacterium]
MSTTKSFFQKIKEFLYPIKYSKFNFVASLICGFIGALVSTYLVIFLKYITNAIEVNDWEKVKYHSIICFIVISVRFFIRTFYKIFPFGLIRDTHSSAYKDLMSVFFKGNNNEIEKIGTGRIISIIQKGLWSWTDLILEVSWSVSNRIFVTVIVFYTIGKVNIYVMFVGIIVLIFSILWGLIFYPKAIKWRRKCKIVDTEVDRIIILHIMNKFEIFQNNKQDEEIDRIFEKNNEWYYYKIREKIWQGFSYDGIEYFVNILLLSTALYFSYLIFNGSSTLGDFVLFTGFATLLGNQIRTAIELSKKFSDSYIHIEKMNELIEKISEKGNDNEKNKKEYIFKNGDIEIKNINFAYDKSKIFNNFSLNITGGTKIAFVGESGGGKSTLIKLLAGYMKVDSGDVIIDGQKLSKIKLSDYYKHIGYLTQDPSVFDGTILENLTYALKEKPSKEELDKCIKLSKCEFIYELKKGLETEIGERGIRLSGGQKQRLAIAKIMLKNPNIILLDEPTSALDSFNEELINIALHNLFKGKTVIVIAHRLQTVKEADRILLFDNGMVVEDGTHRELIKLNGKYKKMLDLQSGF